MVRQTIASKCDHRPPHGWSQSLVATSFRKGLKAVTSIARTLYSCPVTMYCISGWQETGYKLHGSDWERKFLNSQLGTIAETHAHLPSWKILAFLPDVQLNQKFHLSSIPIAQFFEVHPSTNFAKSCKARISSLLFLNSAVGSWMFPVG